MIPVRVLRAEGQYDPDAVSDATGLECKDESRAKQSFKDECDINTIVERFGLTGELPSGVAMPQHGDFTGLTSFHAAMNEVVAAREAFSQFPAKVRARFHNDIGEFVDFCSDPANQDEAVKLGLVAKVEAPKPAEPMPVRIVEEPKATS